MNIIKATADFEQWLAGQLPIIRQDLALKHKSMAEAAFPFFRATFYRWLQLWPELCGDLVKAPACCPWVICTSKTSEHGETKKDASSGA
jgi:hypothetical protein